MSEIQVHDAGRFNRQLSVENLVQTHDEIGGFTEQYAMDGSVWAHVCPESVSVRIVGDQQDAQTTHRILLRFRHDIKPGTRFVTGSRRFEVITVKDVDETRRYIECRAVEQ